MFDRCLYFNTTALARRLEREWASAFALFELSPPQAFMLRAVLAKPGMPQRELAAAMSIARPTATRALDFLQAKEFIVRSSRDGDAREICIYPTEKAFAIHDALNAASAAVTRKLKASLGNAEFNEAVATVARVRSVID